MRIYLYIAIAAGVSFLIRVLPLTLIRKQITNPFLRSFLYYVPYVTLAVMTFPAILHAAQSPVAGAIALIVGAVLAWLGAGLLPVAISCCAAVFLAELLLRLCEPGMIDKTRWLVPAGDGRHTWEVDEFHGDNDGLVMAEVELQSEDEPYVRPAFVGQEVTGDRRYYNGHLSRCPYSTWGT